MSTVSSTDFDIVDILKKFIKGLIFYYFVEHSILVYRQILYGDLLSVGSLFHRLSYSRHFEEVYKRV